MPGRFETYDDPSVGELIGRLTSEAKAAAQSEIALYRSEISLRFARARTGLAMIVAAIALVHIGLIAAAVSLTIALATLIGPLAAGLVVAAIALGGGYLLVRLAIARIKPAFAPIDGAGR